MVDLQAISAPEGPNVNYVQTTPYRLGLSQIYGMRDHMSNVPQDHFSRTQIDHWEEEQDGLYDNMQDWINRRYMETTGHHENVWESSVNWTLRMAVQNLDLNMLIHDRQDDPRLRNVFTAHTSLMYQLEHMDMMARFGQSMNLRRERMTVEERLDDWERMEGRDDHLRNRVDQHSQQTGEHLHPEYVKMREEFDDFRENFAMDPSMDLEESWAQHDEQA